MLRPTTLLLLILTLSRFASAQVSISQFILTANVDPELRMLEDQIRFLDKKEYRLSPLQRTEIRTQNNQLDISRQEYAIRLTPTNPWESRSNSRYFSQYRNVLSHERSLQLKDALLQRYNFVVTFLYLSELKQLGDEGKRLIDLQVAILERQRNSDYFKGEDYVELKLDQMDKSVEAEEAAVDIESHLRAMAEVYPEVSIKTVNWKTEDIISIENIEKVSDNLLNALATSPTLLYRDSQIELANREYALEKANFNFGFIQTTYENFRIEQGRKPWSISGGITLPITNPNKGDMSKRKLEVIEAEHKREDTETKISMQQHAVAEELKSLIRRYHDIKSKRESLNVGSLSRTLAAVSEENPVAMIRFQENLLKLQAIELKLKQNILSTYVKVLGLTDAIQQTPLINFLSEGLETMYNK